MASSSIPLNEYRDSYNIPTYGGTVYCKRSGNVVNVVVRNLGSTSNIPQGQNINISVGMDDKYKPKNTLLVNGQLTGNYSGDYSALYTLQTNGIINVYSYKAITAGSVNFTFIV